MQPKKNIQGLPIYQPGKPIEEVKREFGLSDVIKLASNENPFHCSKKVWESLYQEKDLFHFYPEDLAPRLSQKIAQHEDIDERRLIFGNGSDEVIQMICRTYLDSGAESIMADITFPRYKTGTLIEGGKAIEVPLVNGTHDLQAMLLSITEKTRVIWICNPNNPTGTIIDHQALAKFLDQVPDHVLVVLDEAYNEYVVDEDYPDSLSLLDYNPRIVILRTFSKIYGLAAFRIGYGIAHPDVIRELSRVREPFNTNRLAQTAAISALDDQSFVTYCRNQNRLGLKQLTEQLDQWGNHYFTTQANFLLFDTGYPSEEAFQFLLKRGMIVRSGQALGYPTYLRVTIGTKEQNQQFLELYAAFRAEKERLM